MMIRKNTVTPYGHDALILDILNPQKTHCFYARRIMEWFVNRYETPEKSVLKMAMRLDEWDIIFIYEIFMGKVT